MIGLSEAITIASPYYNLALVIVILFLFVKLFRTRPTSPSIYMKPWFFFFYAVLVFIVEEVLTVLRAAGSVTIDVFVNGFFELIIISLILYGLLLQREHLKKTGHIR